MARSGNLIVLANRAARMERAADPVRADCNPVRKMEIRARSLLESPETQGVAIISNRQLITDNYLKERQHCLTALALCFRCTTKKTT